MYLISYQKRNGEVFCRIRNTIPDCGIGHETSMGWKVVDIKYWFKNGFYSTSQYNKLYTKNKNKKQFIKKIHIIYNFYEISNSFCFL